MKIIRAYSCNRDGVHKGSGKVGGPVCFLLDEAHARHTLRTFLRDQGDGAVLKPMSDAEASRLLGADSDTSPTARK
jgi:hypothetical protein